MASEVYHCILWWHIAVHSAVGEKQLPLEIGCQGLIGLFTIMHADRHYGVRNRQKQTAVNVRACLGRMPTHLQVVIVCAIGIPLEETLITLSPIIFVQTLVVIPCSNQQKTTT